MTTTDPLRWDASYLFASVADRAIGEAIEQLGADADRLVARFDHAGVRSTGSRPVTGADGEVIEALLAELNRVLADANRIEAFLYSVTTTDSRDEDAARLAAQTEAHAAKLRPLLARLAGWVAALGVDELAAHSNQAAEHLGPLRKLAQRAEHQMSDSDEGLYAEMRLSGSSAWSQLHADLTSQLRAEIDLGDGATTMPITRVRGLAAHHDPSVRRHAYEAEIAAWPSVLVACAAAINGVKGEACVVNRRRGWNDPVDASLFANNVSQATFTAMQDAITDALPLMRRWMLAKARLHGHPGPLPWWDLVAPAPGASSALSWTEAAGTVESVFGAYSESLADVLRRAVRDRWIDVEPRDGKVGGAFCMDTVEGRSLVLLNWNGSLEGASTLAHELGHAYHNVQLAGRTMLQRSMPMTLAETASIMCETLMTEHLLAAGDADHELAVLDLDLAGANQLLVDIRSRFEFERAVFARRQRGTLGVTELNELMLAAQRDVYGDGLDQATAHPYMWAVKGHYYGAHFYNWPYAFGYLFGLGLYAEYRRDPERFRSAYDDALSRVGMEDAEPLARRFGLDIEDAAFWQASTSVVARRVERYEALIARRTSTP